MRTIEQVESDIQNVRNELTDVHGTSTEVYARIVGYYRSVRNWNKGKREEYRHRKLFIADEGRIESHLEIDQSMHTEAPIATSLGGISRYELFVRKTCPNCPPVKECCTNLPLSGAQIDVDSEEGREAAINMGILSAPTVIFYDSEGNEVSRAHSVREIRALPISVAEASLN